MTPSVRPLKWQLEHDCQPSDDSRSSVETVAFAGRLKWPREEKTTSAPTLLISSWLPAAGSGDVRMVSITVSFARFRTDTFPDTKLFTYARGLPGTTTMPCGFLPALSPAVSGLAG